MMENKILEILNPVECRIVGRLNRFVVEIQVENKNCHASINNTGRLEQFLVQGRRAFCMSHQKPLKTDYRLFAIADGDEGAVIDTQLQMRAFEKALEYQYVPWLEGFRMVKRNARLGASLIDYLLERNGVHVLLEVKSAVFREGDHAMYPDCPTARGRKHLRELMDHVHCGNRAIILFLAALPQVKAFKPSRIGDPELCDLLTVATAFGVETRAMGMAYYPEDSFIGIYDPDLSTDLG